MVKKRHHHIPRLLLRRFAFRANKKSAYLWQFRRGGSPIEVETRNAGVESFFYGDPATGIEDDLAKLETTWATLLAEVDAAEDLRHRHEELRRFVWILAFRTRALRGHFGNTAVNVVNSLAEADPATIADALRRGFESDLDAHWEATLASLPTEVGAAIRAAVAKDPPLKQRILDQARNAIPSSGALATRVLRSAAPALQQGAERGQLKALSKILGDHSWAPSGEFAPASWIVLRFDPHSVILGDGVVFALGPQEQTGTIARFAGDWREVYVPISHGRVLVGRREGVAASLDLTAINAASAGLSHESFFAARDSATERALASRIGTVEPMLTEEDRRNHVDETWGGVGGRPSS